MSTNVAGPFSLRVGGRGARPLVSLRGREELSRVFRLDARVLCEPDERVAVVGERASVTLSGKDGRGRTVHGVVERVSVEGVIRAGGERVVRVRVVPRLAMLRHRVTSVVHVEQTVPEVVAGALGLAGVRVTTRLTRAYAKRAYCVQYKESTLAFVRRILAEEGVLFTFDHGDADSGEDSVVLFDAAEGYGKLEPQTLTLRRRDAREGRPGSGDDVLEFALESAAAPDRALLRDYDPQKPLLDLRVSARAGVTPPVGGAELLAYEHRGPYAEADVESPPAEVALEQRRRGAVVGRGTSTSRAIAPGLAFRLDAETTPELSGAYAITSIEHDLAQHAERDGQLVYENRFTCAPADVAHRPPRPRQRVRQVLETAIVVGPAGEEIHTDALGRVQVRFHWQIGDAGDGASTWLRVMQPWTGAGFGAHFVPRVGSEVMVTFLGGDPDAPVVVGGVYNATSPPPFALPADKTRSGLRTRTSPGGAGANELSFEDAAGSEQIFLKAQRDLDIDVGRDATTHVKRNASRVVGGSDTSDTAGDARAQIGGDHAVTIGGSASTRITGARTLAIAGPLTTEVLGGRSARVVGRDALDLDGPRDEAITGDASLRVAGTSATIVGTSDAPRSLLLHANGASTLSATDVLEIASETGIRLRCGTSILEIAPDRIGVTASSIELRSPKARVVIDDDTVRIKADRELKIVCEQAIVKTDDASIALATEVQVDGKQILLNSPAEAEDPLDDDDPEPTTIDLVDDAGAPIPNQRYELVMSDGSRRAGFLDENGHAELDLDADATVTFPGLLDAASA